MGVVEPAERLEERWEDGLPVGPGLADGPSGDKGGGVLQRPDIAGHGFGDPQGQAVQVLVGGVGHHQQGGQVLEAAADLAQYGRATGFAGAAAGRGGQVPGHHGGREPGLGAQHRLGLARAAGPAYFQALGLHLALDPLELLRRGFLAAARVPVEGE